MSRLGKKPIPVPAGVDVKIEDGRITVKGPKGELVRDFDAKLLKMEKTAEGLVITPQKQNWKILALWGTYASHAKNMMKGVTGGFSKVLVIEGIGFRAQTEGKQLVLNLGFSHPVKMAIPEGIEIKVEKNKINISGFNKELVGQTAATIRSLKKPEPYKGKGIRYEKEIIRKKAGKKAVGAGS
jgi:large subunit ribosomal protein L6